MKHLFLLLTMMFAATLMVGCTGNTEPEPSLLDTAYQQLTLDITTDNLTLPTTSNGVAIVWSANIEGILVENTLIPLMTPTEVVLTAEMSHEERTITKTFIVTIPARVLTNEERIANAKAALTLDVILAGGSLPTSLDDIQITWTASVPELLDGTTIVAPIQDTEVILSALLTLGETTDTKYFTITILGDASPIIATLEDAIVILTDMLTDGTQSGITTDLDLPTTYNDIVISYFSDDPSYLSDDGIITRPSAGSADVEVDLTVTVSLSGIERSFVLTYTVLAETGPIYTGYYEGADGLLGDALRTFLHDLIDDHTVLTYAQLWDALADTDEDPNNPNNVVLIYSQVSMDEDAICSATCPTTASWNREHVWPKSHGGFDTDDVEGTDLHHIRPSLVVVNSSRGNLDFDDGGSLVSQTTDAYKDGDSFEPPDDVKGDIARMIFYMAIRYEGDIAGELDLELNDAVNNTGPYVGRLSILLLWHEQDPVDAFELHRNDQIQLYQGNRNPFIDHPEFVTYIWNID